MAQRHVETVIGRLATDEELRTAFLANPEDTLTALTERGLALSRTEMAALVATDRDFWVQAVRLLDTRLQKASLGIAPHSQENDHD